MKRFFGTFALVVFSFIALFWGFTYFPYKLPLVARLCLCTLATFLIVVFILGWIKLYKMEQNVRKKLPLLSNKTKVVFISNNTYRKRKFLITILNHLEVRYTFECFAYFQDGIITLEVTYEKDKDCSIFYFTSPIIFFRYFDIFDNCS